MLTAKTILGAGWSVSSRLASRAIDFATLLILARTLGPTDFGLTAIAMTLIAITDTVLEIPLAQALTRLRQISKLHLDTAFTLGAMRACLLGGFILAAAWPFSIIYSDERLAALVAVLAMGPMARGVYSPAMVNFYKQLDFKKYFLADFSGKILAASLAIAVLYLGGGYWAIAVSSVASSVIPTMFSYVLAPYRPAFSLAKLPEFSKFIGWFTSAQIVAAINWQLDRVVLGRYVSKAELGQYTMASDLAVLPTQSLIGPAMQPVMAAFSKINDNLDRLKGAYLKASHYTMLLAMPICAGISSTSDMIVDLILGSKWDNAAFYLRWIAFPIALTAYFQPLYSLALAINRPNVIFQVNFADLSVRILLISLGFYFFSFEGVIVARGIAALVIFALTLASAESLIGISVLSQLRNLSKVFLACFAMTLSVTALRYNLDQFDVHVAIRLALTAAFGGGVYFGTLFVLGSRFRALG
ncbi:lipopolysaccharide biosynthesis protein [Microvirga sp. KLBC 81]|uniref:lipopolysaccharide biosynthesis protein n=1 Tax=Microvirga sp. KLBC 81 TaxID=1862707 RepID=UPI000D516F43|nr:lipopolysaccharide biosynthesis protein [Microvirga sp. KLBC 81]PVE20651.1 lipopolysaccharide biosynthesis protein [Microvirga sp. KLBC 81]